MIRIPKTEIIVIVIASISFPWIGLIPAVMFAHSVMTSFHVKAIKKPNAATIAVLIDF